MCDLYGITKTRKTPYHPEGNVQGKRFNRTLHNLLKTLPQRQKCRWSEHLSAVVYVYNITENAATWYSPFYLMFGCDPKLPVDLLLGAHESHTENVTPNTLVNEWLSLHTHILTRAFQKAGEILTQQAA